MAMESFRISFEEPAWPDLADGHYSELTPVGIAVIPDGTIKGRPAVAFRLRDANGNTYLGQTTARLFCAAGQAIQARYPDLFEGED